MSKKDIQLTIKKYYEEILAIYGDDPKGVNWRDYETQKLRFEILSSIGNLNNKRVHDVGCGLGHYNDFILTKGINVNYIGTDISSKMINVAMQKKSKTANFKQCDLLEDDFKWMYADYVVNSGVFTVKNDIDNDAWWIFVSEMIAKMFHFSNVGIGFNMMTSYVDFKDEKLFYKNPLETFDFCAKNLSKKIVLRHDYKLWEYFIFVYK